jgi:hypothetical protein
MRIPDFIVTSFPGLNTKVKDTKTLDRGVAIDSKNWMTGDFKDHIELRRGSLLLGETREDGAGKITGMGIGKRRDGVQIPFFSHGRKVKYYDTVSEDNIEVGSDLLSADQDGEDVWFAPYDNLAGSHMYLGGAKNTIQKIPVANPGSSVDQLMTTYRFGTFKAGQGRAFAGQREGTTGIKDATSIYLSYIDHALFSAFTPVTGESVGSSGSTHYTKTLTERTGKRTVFLVVVKEATGETLSDDQSGNLVGDQGSTGTVNYATGAIDVTFNHTTAGAVTVDYYYEDATSAGILDFSQSATRTSGQGNQFLQADGGGKLQAIHSFVNVEYCFHILKTWQVTTALDDTGSTNLNYRSIGIPNHRAACPTSDGILLIDNSNENEPVVRHLEIGANTAITTVVPTDVSETLDLSGYAYDYAVAFRWGKYWIISIQEKKNGTAQSHNSICFVRNTLNGAWDKLDYRATCFAEYNGALLAGDSISNNVFILFSGFDDDEQSIDNYWIDAPQNLGTNNSKRAGRMTVSGLIQKDQKTEVLLSFDDAPFVKVFTIEGNGAYVDSGVNTSIGSTTIGSKVIGGGGDEVAHPFTVDFVIQSDIFQNISVKFKATDIGYVEIDEYGYRDIRDKGRKYLPAQTI